MQISCPEILRPVNYAKTIKGKAKIFEQVLLAHPEDRHIILINKALLYWGSPSNHSKCIAICKDLINTCTEPNIYCMACWFIGCIYEED